MEIVLMNDHAIIPSRASKESAGLDLYSSIDIDTQVCSIKKVNTGICISLPENSYRSIRDKFSLASKGLLALGGVIDKDYTGEIIVIMTSLMEPIKIKKGQKITQLIVSNIMYPEIKKVKSLKDTISLFSVLKVNTLECLSLINRECMPRPKILNVKEGIGEALFYPYNVLVNKCSGSCDTLDNPMSKICADKIIKNVNMKVYNFLMRSNETRNVL